VRIVRWVGWSLVAAVAGVAIVAVAARWSDGPIGPFAGGALQRGDWIEDDPADWSFVADQREIEFQLLSPPRSRTTWVLVRDGQIYLPCGVPEFRLWKHWPHEAMLDGRSVVRIDGRLYRRNAMRVTEPEVISDLAVQLASKYELGAPPESLAETVWFFRLDPRPDL